MKLQSPSWKSIWFDNHLSERFLKEWNRLEQGPLQEIESTSAWMDQIVIELGQLAQSMIHLEESETHTSHLRLALDRSLKLSVMAARLAGSLQATYRDSSMDAADFLMAESSSNSPSENPNVQSQPPMSLPGVAVETVPPAQVAADGLHGPQSQPVQVSTATVANPAPRQQAAGGQVVHQQTAQTALPASLPHSHPAQINPPMAQDPRYAHRVSDQRKISPEQERLILASSRGKLEKENKVPERPMNETILTLSDRGLSLDEIEIVTGQPRATIEKVLSAN